MEAVVKKRRSVIKRLKKEEAKIAKQHGAADAKLQNVPTSTRKMRLVADLIRGKKVNVALSILKFQPKIGAQRLEKLLLSAISNWQAKNADARLEDADLFVKEIFVDGGRMLKRLRPAPQGRGHRVRKRSNHVSLTIDSLNAPAKVVASEETASKSKAAKPKAEAKTKAAKPAAKKTSKKTDNK
jgi:large subunit ribosomal protein L22